MTGLTRPFLEQAVAELESLGVVADDDRDDRRGIVGDGEADRAQALPGVKGVLMQLLDAFGLALDDLERGVGGGHGRGRHAGGKDEGHRMVFDEIDDFLRPAAESAQRSEGLAERAHDDVDVPAVLQAVMLGHAAAGLAKDSQGVGLVDHDPGALGMGFLDQLGQVDHDPGHAENGVADDQRGRIRGMVPAPWPGFPCRCSGSA